MYSGNFDCISGKIKHFFPQTPIVTSFTFSVSIPGKGLKGFSITVEKSIVKVNSKLTLVL